MSATKPRRHVWTSEQAREAGRKGGRTPRKGKRRTEDWKGGYGAGWIACERFWCALTVAERAERVEQIERGTV